MNLLIIPLICLLTYGIHEASSQTDSCDNSNFFHISINKKPTYEPKFTYIVGIESNDIQPFTSFSITAEPEEPHLTTAGRSTGWFHLMANDTEAQLSQYEINTITERSNSPKQGVHVLWTAPSNQNCLVFKAKVNYEVDSKSCTQKFAQPFCVSDEQPSSQADEERCACDEAQYTVTFERLWDNVAATYQLDHFRVLLGFTHSKNFTLWAEGQYATEGLKQLAEYASTSILESQYLNHNKHWKTKVNIFGMWYKSHWNRNTTVKFGVDRKHNLLSLVTKLGPSPDWFSGISKLNLCTKNCTWVENKVVDLALYDAGTDSDSYSCKSQSAKTIPQQRIHRVIGSYFEDTMKPVARLHIRREGIIRKSCSDESETKDIDNSGSQLRNKDCRTTKWSEWSNCTATCGFGYVTRTRSFLNVFNVEYRECSHVNIVEKKECRGPPCVTKSINCTTTKWNEWSPCSKTCGNGVSSRTRDLTVPEDLQSICKNYVKLEEQKQCNIKDCTPELCQLPADGGVCRAYFEQYYFDSKTNQCTKFTYGGCGGNENKFMSLNECMQTCSGSQQSTTLKL